MIGIILGILFGIGLLACIWEFLKYWFGEFFEKKKPASNNEKALQEFAEKELKRARRMQQHTTNDPEFNKIWDDNEHKNEE